MQVPDLVPILPEIVLLLTACAVLIVDLFTKQDRTAAVALSLGGLVVSLGLAVGLSGEQRLSFSGAIVLNSWAIFFRILFALIAALTITMSGRYLAALGRHLGEYYALILFAVAGMDLMAASRDFVSFYVALELMAVSSYILAAFFRYQVKSNESALKYFLTGTFASAILLYGISLLYGLTGSTLYQAVARALDGPANRLGVIVAIVLVAVGLAFKVSAVPFHMWTPDVYQGAPTPVAAFFSVGPKAAAFSAILAIFVGAFPDTSRVWGVLFVVLSIVTMLGGNLYGLVQTNVKRMLAYSSIAHAGYMLAAVGAVGLSRNTFPALTALIYLASYAVMNLGAFGVLTFLKAVAPGEFDYSLEKMAGLGKRAPWPAVLLSIFLISLTGIPGTVGFVGKFYVFSSIVNADLVWLAVIGVVLSAVSAYYYLRVVMYMFFREPEVDWRLREGISGGVAATLSLTAIAAIVLGVMPSWLWEAALRSISNFVGR